MKRLLLTAILPILILSLVFTSCKKPVTPSPEEEQNTPAYTTVLPAAEGETNAVQFIMENGATFVVELYPQYAPETVANFRKLVKSGFYDGLTFHRVVKDFMIQGGDPSGSGKTAETIVGEFADNGYTENTLSHTRGVISMARISGQNDSASSQFFIMHSDKYAASLDGKYAAFGKVVSGIETVDEIANVEVTTQPLSGERSKPVQPPVIKSAYFVVWESAN